MGEGDPRIPSVKTALEQARDALNKVSGAVNPFAAGYVLLANPTRLQQEIAKYGSTGTSEKFKTDFWEGSTGVFNRYLTSAQNAVGINKWNKLTDNEKTALYSLVYNGGSGMIGGGGDHQPAAGLTLTSTTESALLVQAISSFYPGSSSSTGDLSSESWKSPELYSPGTVREMMKNIT